MPSIDGVGTSGSTSSSTLISASLPGAIFALEARPRAASRDAACASAMSFWMPSWIVVLSASCGQRLAVHLAHQIRGHLARAEARHAHLRRDALHLGVDLGVDFLGGDLERVGALQALVQRLDSLHLGFPKLDLKQEVRCSACARAAGLVRAKGLEPPHLSIPEPKSSASTSSATPACGHRRQAARL